MRGLSSAGYLLALLEELGRHVHAVLLARAEQLGLEAVDLLVQLLDVRRLADLLVDLQDKQPLTNSLCLVAWTPSHLHAMVYRTCSDRADCKPGHTTGQSQTDHACGESVCTDTTSISLQQWCNHCNLCSRQQGGNSTLARRMAACSVCIVPTIKFIE